MNERKGRRGIYVPELVDAIIRKTIDSYIPPAEKSKVVPPWQSMVGCSYTANQNARSLELNYLVPAENSIFSKSFHIHATNSV